MSLNAEEKYIVYIDTGGTFSDVVIVKSDGTFVTGKASTANAFDRQERNLQMMLRGINEVIVTEGSFHLSFGLFKS